MSAYQPGDVVRRRNLVTGEIQTGIVLSVDAHLVTTRWHLTGEHTMVRVQHEAHAGEHAAPLALRSSPVQHAIATILRAEGISA